MQHACIVDMLMRLTYLTAIGFCMVAEDMTWIDYCQPLHVLTRSTTDQHYVRVARQSVSLSLRHRPHQQSTPR